MTDATELDEAGIRARLEAACAELDRMTQAPGGPGASWRWSIPANPERDTDLLLSASLADVERLLAALDEARSEVDTHREVAESMTGLWEQAKDRANRLEAMADRLADRRANHEPWHCCCAEGSHSGQAAALNRMKARAEAAESALAAVKALATYRVPATAVGVINGLPGWMAEPQREVVRLDDLRAALATPTTTEETQP